MHWTFLARSRSSYYSLGGDNDDPVVFISHNVGPGSRVEDYTVQSGRWTKKPLHRMRSLSRTICPWDRSRTERRLGMPEVKILFKKKDASSLSRSFRASASGPVSRAR